MMLNRLLIFTTVTLGAVTEALAQATSPATSGSPAAPTDGGSMAWLWIIVGLAIIAGLVWYFMRGRSRTTTTDTTSGTSGTTTGRASVYDNDKRK
jgi:hypothetical protein